MSDVAMGGGGGMVFSIPLFVLIKRGNAYQKINPMQDPREEVS